MLPHELKTIVGSRGWSTDERILEPHLNEWRQRITGKTLMMVSPKSTEEVAAVVAACQRAGVGVVPQGGNTGLCGGAIPDESGEQVLMGHCEGQIANHERGDGGFGYDPLFVPASHPERHMAELTETEKNTISHRGVALKSLRHALISLQLLEEG